MSQYLYWCVGCNAEAPNFSNGGISEEFRAPNFSALSRLDSASSNKIETPSPDLNPEHFTSYEIGNRVNRDRSDTQRIPPGGTPGYILLNFRSGFQVNEQLLLTAGIEGTLDLRQWQAIESDIPGDGSDVERRYLPDNPIRIFRVKRQ